MERRSASGAPASTGCPKNSLANLSQRSRSFRSGLRKTCCTAQHAACRPRPNCSWKARARSKLCPRCSDAARTSPTTCMSGGSSRKSLTNPWMSAERPKGSPSQAAQTAPYNRSGSQLCAAFSIASRNIIRWLTSSPSRLSCNNTCTCAWLRGSCSRSMVARCGRCISAATLATSAYPIPGQPRNFSRIASHSCSSVRCDRVACLIFSHAQ
mmetsp:Transcript_130360/g.260032  ORF Transcript_130360/g.260032 Transcript_130360/m.260032 type:complete len:211 (-) Transcript_130360:1518-2150(-)